MFGRNRIKIAALAFGKKAKRQGKKIVFLVLLVILAAFGAGFFYYWNFYETPVEKWSDAEYSPAEDYKVIESEEGIFVENKKAGISFKVPDGWRIEEYFDQILLKSPDIEGSIVKRGGIEKGCEIAVEVSDTKTSISTLENQLKKLHDKEYFKDESYQIVDIDGHQTLQNQVTLTFLDNRGLALHIPVKRTPRSKLYFIRIASKPYEFEFCKEVFEDFVKTVSIQ